MKSEIRINSYRLPRAECLPLAAATGVDGIQLYAKGTDYNLLEWTQEELEHLRRSAAAHRQKRPIGSARRPPRQYQTMPITWADGHAVHKRAHDYFSSLAPAPGSGRNEMLIGAKAFPERCPNLVRISGCSTHFTTLDASWQE